MNDVTHHNGQELSRANVDGYIVNQLLRPVLRADGIAEMLERKDGASTVDPLEFR